MTSPTDDQLKHWLDAKRKPSWCTCSHPMGLHTTMQGIVGLINRCTAPDCECHE